VQVVTYYLLKAVLSVLLLFIIAFAIREVYRLWFVHHITLAKFAYQKDGVENEGQGNAFRQRVYQELRGLQTLLEAEPATELVPTLAHRSPGQVTTLVPAPKIWVMEGLKIPEIPDIALEGIEIKVHGVDFGSLARSLFQWMHPPDEFAGSVIEVNNSFRTLVEWRRVGRTDANLRLVADGHRSLDSATIATASNILYLLILDREKTFDKKLSRNEFQIFVRSLRDYSTYHTTVTEMRPKEARDKARQALDGADELATGLIDRGAGERFSSVYVLGAITAIAKNDFPRARDYVATYEKVNPSDTKTPEELAKMLPPAPVQVAAAQRVEGAGIPQKKYRPVQPGVSAGSVESSAGTICCLVRDKAGSRNQYFLSSEHVFAGEPGVGIVQPSPFDGGSAPRDQIARVARTVKPDVNAENRIAGALAAITENTPVNPDCFAIGAFAGVADVSSGEQVTLVGRTSGVSEGQVIAVDSVTSIWLGEANQGVMFSGLIVCQKADGGSFSDSGDSGAPVVNARNELVGMLYAGSVSESMVIPIKPILDHFDVELVTKKSSAQPSVGPDGE